MALHVSGGLSVTERSSSTLMQSKKAVKLPTFVFQETTLLRRDRFHIISVHAVYLQFSSGTQCLF